MGFLDKLKNTFFEEEYVEVEEKPKKQQVKQEVIKKPIIKEEKYEEPEEEKIPSFEEVKEEKEEPKEEKFSYFDEEDFMDYQAPKIEEEKYEEPEIKYEPPVYGSKKVNNNIQSSPYANNSTSSTKFQPTPIISPIYGVLDKNYTKEEVQEKKEIKPSSYVSRKHADLDSIRAKAFGTEVKHEEPTLEETLEDDFTSFEDEIDTDSLEDNLLYDMTEVDKTPSVDKVTIQDAEEYFDDLGLEYNIDYKDAKLEKATGRRVTKNQPIDELENDDIIDFKEDNKKEESNDTDSLEDNLFDLIDSMYEEKE